MAEIGSTTSALADGFAKRILPTKMKLEVEFEMAVEKSVRQSIEAVIRKHLNGIKIVSIAMREVEGLDGDRLLKVTVIYETRSGVIDGNKTVSLARSLRPTLRELQIDAFPIFSFVSKAEAGRPGARA